MKLGRHIQTLRTALDVSLRDASTLTGINIVHLGEIERDLAEITPEFFTSMAIALMKPTREENQRRTTEFRRRISNALRRR